MDSIATATLKTTTNRNPSIAHTFAMTTTMTNSEWSRCKYCGAKIIWAKYREPPHKPAPIDAQPVLKDGKDYGNIWLVREGAGYTYHILEPEVAANARARNFDLYTNHLATCPARERTANSQQQTAEQPTAEKENFV